MRIFRYRVLKFKPRIATTYRPHGKWGDLIVCLLPVSWCANIITNSNFILRMIEWQAESSLFTLRVRGKQWYWVYKYDLKAVTDVLTAPKNIGNNKWVISNPFDLQLADDYLHIHQLRAQSNWIQNYWETYLDGDIHNLTVSKDTSAFIGDLDFYTNYVQAFSDKKIMQIFRPNNYLFTRDDLFEKFNKKLVNPANISLSYNLLGNDDAMTLKIELFGELLDEIFIEKFEKIDFLFNQTSLDNLLNFMTPEFNKTFKLIGESNPLPTNSIFIDNMQNFTNYFNVKTKTPLCNPDISGDRMLTLYSLKNIFEDVSKLRRTTFFRNEFLIPDYHLHPTRVHFYNQLNDYYNRFFFKLRGSDIFNRKIKDFEEFFQNFTFNFKENLTPTHVDFFTAPELVLPLNLTFRSWYAKNYLQFNWLEDEAYLINPDAPSFKNDFIPLRYSGLFIAEDFLANEYVNLADPLSFSEGIRSLQNYLCYPWRGAVGRSFSHSDAPESAFNAQRGLGIKQPVRLIKFPLSFVKENQNSDVVELFRVRFGSGKHEIEYKNNAHQTYFIFKQKRLKRLGSVKTKIRYYMDWQGNPTERIHTTYQPYVTKNRLVMADRKSHMTHYELVKTSRKRQENISLPFNKRLLRTRRMVVLPAHVNISVITNSFDVVHSWFIPGLGIKLDCIPGRSTHHVLHIDNVGFYYGQCAEICGRYHHHMPIRICALPFEHFMVWWHAFAMPRMLKAYDEPLTNLKKDRYFYSAKKYVW